MTFSNGWRFCDIYIIGFCVHLFAGPNSQTDRQEDRCQGGHQLQHDQWCQKCQAYYGKTAAHIVLQQVI